MSWFAWTAAAILLTSVEQVLNRRYLSRTPQHWEYLVGYNVGALVMVAVLLLPILKPMDPVPRAAIPFLATSSLLWFFACFFGFKADQRVEVGATSLLGQTQLIVVFLGGVLLFGEPLSPHKVAGSALVLVGLSFLGGPIKTANKAGLVFKLVSAVAGAAALLIDKHLTGLVAPALIPVVGFLIPTLLAVGLRPRRLAQSVRLATNSGGMNVALGAVGALAYYSLIRAFAAKDVSVAYPAYQLNLLITVLAGHFLLRESGRLPAKVAAAGTVLMGAVWLAA